MLHLRAVKPRGLQKTPFPPGAAFLSVCLAAARRGIASGVRSSPLWLCPWLIACSEAGSPPPPAVTSCRADPAALARAQVVHVVDGDTVHFEGGDKVRLIGVNAPEMNHDGRPAEPLAREATAALRGWVDDRPVLVRDGDDARDRYGRRLAHLFDLDGNSIEEHLLREGLAFHVAVPPNTRMADCLQRAEADAARAELGVWGHPRYQPVPVSRLEPGRGGFTRVSDRVTRVSFKDNGWWIQLGGKLGARVRGDAQALFGRDRVRSLEGRRVEVRGWLVPRRDWWQMELTHPSMLRVE